MKKTTLPALIIALFLTACTSGEKPPTYAELQQYHQTDETAATDTEPETADPAESEAAELREKAAEAVSEILTENREVKFGKTVWGTQTAVECDGGIYIILNKISLLNRSTGKLQGLCTDPLCRHESCIESHSINSMISDGDKLYFKGNSTSYSELSDKWDSASFVASYDPQTDKLEYLDVWEKDHGEHSSCLALHNGSLYYTKKMNDQTNSLFRIPQKGGQKVRLTFSDEFVLQMTVTDEEIIYRTQDYTLKSMKHDGSDVIILGEKICMSHASGGDMISISSKSSNGGHEVYRNGETLPDRVFSPASTVLADGALWYTLPDEQILGTYIDKNGRKQNIKTYNGTSFYRYDLSTGERTEYDCPFAYGVQEFCAWVGKYMIIKACAEDRLICFWIFNSEDPGEAYRLYEY